MVEEAPYQQFEYPQALFLVTIPPVWFYIVNDRVDAITQLTTTGKKSKLVQIDNNP